MTDEKELPGGSAEVRPDIIFRDLREDNDRPALNEPEGVELVVRDFVSRMVEYRKGYLTNGKASEPPQGFADKEADRMTDIFFGKDADYEAFPWNAPDQLGYAFGDRVGIDGDDPVAVMQAFWEQFAANLWTLMAEHEAGLDDGDAKFKLDVMVEEAVYALLGLPLSAD